MLHLKLGNSTASKGLLTMLLQEHFYFIKITHEETSHPKLYKNKKLISDEFKKIPDIIKEEMPKLFLTIDNGRLTPESEEVLRWAIDNKLSTFVNRHKSENETNYLEFNGRIYPDIKASLKGIIDSSLKNTEPKILEKTRSLANVAKKTFENLQDKLKVTASSAVQEERSAKCLSCPFNTGRSENRLSKCLKCGCYLPAKVTAAVSFCPISLWDVEV